MIFCGTFGNVFSLIGRFTFQNLINPFFSVISQVGLRFFFNCLKSIYLICLALFYCFKCVQVLFIIISSVCMGISDLNMSVFPSNCCMNELIGHVT